MEETTITSLADYSKLELRLISLADRASKCTTPDKEIMKELQKERKFVQDTGKFLRDDYNRLAKEVIGREKELLGIIVPHEERLKRLKEEEEAEKERLYRVSRFEARAERMATIELYWTSVQNEQTDDAEFENIFQEGVLQRNIQKELELADRERKVLEEEERQAKIKRDEEWAAKIREEEKAKAEQAVKDADERAKRAEQDAKEKVEHDENIRKEREAIEKILAENREEAEKKKLEADIAYQLFLESHDFVNDGTFKIEKLENSVFLYKLVGTLDLE